MIKWHIILGLGFKEFESTKRTISGIEVFRMIKKNQLLKPENSIYKSFISLAMFIMIQIKLLEIYLVDVTERNIKKK